MDRKARQAGMDWTLKVATIVERLPVVMPDKEAFETEFEDLQAYLKAHSGKAYPKEFMGTDKGVRPEAYTDEDLMGKNDEEFLCCLFARTAIRRKTLSSYRVIV
mgnify:CR=1 FL=1